jgi:hypothetical protein
MVISCEEGEQQQSGHAITMTDLANRYMIVRAILKKTQRREHHRVPVSLVYVRGRAESVCYVGKNLNKC